MRYCTISYICIRLHAATWFIHAGMLPVAFDEMKIHEDLVFARSGRVVETSLVAYLASVTQQVVIPCPLH